MLYGWTDGSVCIAMQITMIIITFSRSTDYYDDDGLHELKKERGESGCCETCSPHPLVPLIHSKNVI